MSSLIKVRNFHLPYFGIIFEGGPEFFKGLKGVTKNMNAIKLRLGNFLALKTFSPPPQPPPPPTTQIMIGP